MLTYSNSCKQLIKQGIIPVADENKMSNTFDMK